MTDYQYEPLASGSSNFRLLRLFGFSGGELKCALEPLSLLDENHTLYEALSYTWGSEELVERITLDEKQFWITDNLHAALRYLQLPDRDRCLWIDAICINQADKQEQGHQVQQMDRVFQSAENVLFWLGKATREISSLMDSLSELQSAADRGRSDDPQRLLLSGNTNSNVKSSLQYKGMQQLLGRPWFSRIWILQEVANAKKASICASNKSISAHIFTLGLSLLDISPTSHCQSVLDIMPGRSRQSSWWAGQRNLYTLLKKFRGCKATDERDMVYALLNLSSNKADIQSISITYEQPVQNVIRDTIRYLFQSISVEVHEILNLLTSFTSIDTTYFASASEKERAEEVIHPRTQSGMKISAIQESDGRIDEVYVTKDPASFLLEERSRKNLGDADSCHAQVVQFFQDANKRNAADVKVQQVQFQGLEAVSWGNIEQRVKVLVIKDPEAAILAAAVYGYDQIVKQLQRRLLTGENNRKFDGSALEQAFETGHWPAASVIIKQGADVNAQGGQYGNALQAASYEGNKQIVQLLLDNGADVNAQGGQYGNALQAASYEGNKQIVQLLLDSGADVNAQGGQYGNALQAASASYRGHDRVVQLLLDNGVGVNAQGGEYGNALQAASYEGNKHIIQLLLDNGADVNAQGGQYGNALQATSYKGHKQIVQLLLDNGADVNAQGGQYGNALQAALKEGRKQIVQLLLANGANVNAQGGHCGNALQAGQLYHKATSRS